MARMKITPKRTTLLQKLAYVLRPFVVYMLVKTAMMFLLAVIIPSLPITGITKWVEGNARQLSAVVNGMASLIAVGFLLNDFLIETDTTGEIDIDENIPRQFLNFLKTDFIGNRTRQTAVCLALCAVLGIAASLALNIWIELASSVLSGAENPLLDSGKYGTVESIQYSVPIWLGIVLYGIVSPIVEEIVFRGVLYSRMKKFYSVPRAVVFSALLFGMFHANLPQFLYGTAMGVLIAVCYQYSDCFVVPVLIHMSANSFIFLISEVTVWTTFLMTPIWGLLFAAASVILLWVFIKLLNHKEVKTQAG